MKARLTIGLKSRGGVRDGAGSVARAGTPASSVYFLGLSCSKWATRRRKPAIRPLQRQRQRIGGTGTVLRLSSIAVASFAFSASQALAQDAPPVLQPSRSSGAVVLPTIEVFATTPLSGTGVDIDKVPAGVTIVDAKQIEAERSPSVVKALAQQTPGITVDEVAGNPFQPDVEFRGFDSSPVSGTPQGLAVYQNGVRINEAFGDTVNWDLIPTAAVRSIDVISNNPAFGLNALGGALSVQMKDGFNFQGTAIDVMGGSYGRRQSSLQWGKQVGDYAAYGALEAVQDHGYRDSSPSQIRRFYGDIGYKGDSSEIHLNSGRPRNSFFLRGGEARLR